MSTVKTIPLPWGKPPLEAGVHQVDASSTSSSSAPVTSTTQRVLPNGSTVLMSFLVMSPTAMGARMPPPFTMAPSTSTPSRRAPQTMASPIRSPRFVSSVRLPGSSWPLSRTSVFAKTTPYSSSISLRMAAARAATAASSSVREAMGTVSASMAPVSPSMVTTPIPAILVPVEVITVSVMPAASAAAAVSSRVEWE